MTWPIVALKECARIVGGATPKSEVAEYWDGDIPWTTPKDLSDLEGKFLSDTGTIRNFVLGGAGFNLRRSSPL
ncbi:hypothetical protein ACFSBS_12775, partial [Azospirillum griseum]